MRHRKSRSVRFEVLETRQMLSAAPFAALHADPADQLLAATAKRRIPILPGSWQFSFDLAKGPADFNSTILNFTFTETAKGKVTGTLNVPKLGTQNAPFSMTVSSNDKFSVTVIYDSAATPGAVEKITFSGKMTVGKNGDVTSISGTCRFIAPHNKTVASGTLVSAP